MLVEIPSVIASLMCLKGDNGAPESLEAEPNSVMVYEPNSSDVSGGECVHASRKFGLGCLVWKTHGSEIIMEILPTQLLN